MTFKQVKDYIKQPIIAFFLIGICITFVLALVFLLGAVYSCNVGGGTLYGLTCSEVDIVKACEMDDKIFKMPKEEINRTFIDIEGLI